SDLGAGVENVALAHLMGVVAGVGFWVVKGRMSKSVSGAGPCRDFACGDRRGCENPIYAVGASEGPTK
ncbi:MAG: hypothetical protein ACI92G_002627, partial [Candidatus Pelagisphaera sp.]